MRDRSLSDLLTEETAGGHLSTRVPVTRATTRAGELRATLSSRRYECATHVAVCEQGTLVGILRIEDLLAAAPDTPVADLMDRHPPVVGPGLDQEVAAWRAVQHRESAIAVVDGAGRFVGLIPPHRLLAVLLAEHDEDMARLGGFLKATSVARAASEESLVRRFWHRLPWLLAGLFGALVTADLVAAFESHLRARVMLAFFIPGIVYMADAVGTQTETVVVRGLSVGVNIRRIALRELLTGVSVGLALSVLFFPVLLWRWGSSEVALAVSLSLFVASSAATAVGMFLPWLLQSFKKDPAYGTGPLSTVLQDLISILAYFAIASAIVR